MSSDSLERISFLKFLLSIEGIGPQKIFSIISKFNTLESFLNGTPKSLLSVDGISTTLYQRISSSKKSINDIKEAAIKELSLLEKLNARARTFWDEDYPQMLKEIYSPPVMIYTLGNYTTEDFNSIAIVGTREPTIYGKIMAERFSKELAGRHVTIISGLARGIDSAAHIGALKCGGRTIAVTGSGLDIIYPPENKKIYHQIIENGMIITEYPPGTKPDAQNFPKRNRIISGLSLGTLIIETRLNGGAMQTAAYALDQGREVFAVPGNINSNQSEGPNFLIQRGEAKLTYCADDIIEELKNRLRLKKQEKPDAPGIELNLFEDKILTAIKTEPKHIDDIAIITSIPVSDCLVHLLMMEFKGLVVQLPGKVFRIS